jgi:hypothetical protein
MCGAQALEAVAIAKMPRKSSSPDETSAETRSARNVGKNLSGTATAEN